VSSLFAPSVAESGSLFDKPKEVVEEPVQVIIPKVPEL
jgi:hypothetical protein